MEEGKKLAIIGGTLIDGTGREPLEDMVLIVEGQKIVNIGKKDAISIPRNCERIDASELTIMPGLIDCHVHLTGRRKVGVGLGRLSRVIEPKLLKVIRSTADARKILDAGFTTVRDFSFYGLYLRRAIEEGTIPGPRIIAYGPAIGRTGGQGDLRRDVYQLSLPNQLITNGLESRMLVETCVLCDGVDEIRKVVRMLIGRYVADGIKFYATGGGSWERDKMDTQQFTMDEMKVIVDEAHMAGMRVATHAESLRVIKTAIEVGVDTIEHGDELDEEACKRMVERNVILVSTTMIYDVGSAEWEVQQKSFRLAHSTGVKIALGSDTLNEEKTPFGEHSIKEVKSLVDWGLSPMGAIVAATKTSSEALGILDKVGTLEKGKLADILLVKGNPLVDITVLLDKRNIQTIIKEGKIVRGVW